MDTNQAATLLQGGFTNQQIVAALISFVVSLITSGIAGYYAAYVKLKGEYAAMREGIAEVTRLQKEAEFRAKSEVERSDKRLDEQFRLVIDIEERLAEIRDNFGRFRIGQPVAADFPIVNGESLKSTLVNRLLETRRAILGEEFYVLLKRKYDQTNILWKGDINWDKEMETWNRLTDDVHRQIEVELLKKLPKNSAEKLNRKGN